MSESRRRPDLSAGPGSAPRRRHIQVWLLFALAAMLVAQVLLPADAATPANGAGLPMVMLWWLLLVAFLILVVASAGGPLYWSATDILLAALLLLHTTAGVWAVARAAPRPAVNVTWQWLGIGCSFFLVRQLVRTSQACRAIVAVMIAVGIGLASYGYYQVGVEAPENRRSYEANPDAQLRRALQVDAASNVSPLARRQFEDRLYSPEPYATFILANSLAGYLAAWLAIVFGILCGALPGRRDLPRWSLVGIALLWLAAVGVLWLTRSRTAYLATLAGFVLLAATSCGRRPLRRRTATIAVVSLLLLSALVAGLLSVDHATAAAARRSLAFRWHYWQATMRMITEHPTLGCGPGNFADTYTAYKLPEAYEEVADPHNFVLEVWATAGTLAILALLAAIGWFLARIARQGSCSTKTSCEDDAQALPLLLGATAGLGLAFVMAQIFGTVIDSTLSWQALTLVAYGAVLTIALLYPWIRRGQLPALLVAIGSIVLLVHLLASGGIGNPGVAGSLWVLVAVGLNLTGGADRQMRLGKFAAYCTVLAALILAVLCQRVAYGPTVRMRTAMTAASSAESEGKMAEAREQFHAAADADVWAAPPRRRLAGLAYQRLLEQLSANDTVTLARLRSELQAAVQGWLKTAPHSSSARRQVGSMYLQLYRTSGDQSDVLAAVDAYEHAVRLYPGSNILQADLAWAHHLAGNRSQAARFAARALELDRVTPHEDRKLGSRYQKLADPHVQQVRVDALMQQLLLN